MDDHDILRLGMFVNELQRLHDKYGYWVQNAEVYSPNQADPIATVSAGGGDYTVQMMGR
jgi:hypothetical protein